MADKPDTIVFIHGLWMTPRSWEHWFERGESRGYKTLAPAWPGMEVEVEALNADPTPLEKLDVDTIVDHYDGIIKGSTARRSSSAIRSRLRRPASDRQGLLLRGFDLYVVPHVAVTHAYDRIKEPP